jgi:hypothetical protein
MNIFLLDLNFENNARYHVDKHVVKMPLESAQILSTAVRLSGIDAGYKATHANHPCTKWARESLSNWHWLKTLAFYLNEEWCYRYNHHHFNHKAYEMIKWLPEPNIEDIGLTPFAICMAEEFKISNDPVMCYRNYYNNGKKHLFSWKNREVPEWIV